MDKIIVGVNDLPATHPVLAVEWSKRNKYKPCYFSAHNEEIVWWNCIFDKKHEWLATISARSQGNDGCPYCARASKRNMTLSTRRLQVFLGRFHLYLMIFIVLSVHGKEVRPSRFGIKKLM